MRLWKAILATAALLALIAWGFGCEPNRSPAMSATASGVITAVQPATGGDTRIDYSFIENGAARGGTVTRPGDLRSAYRTGQRVRICFNPADPRLSRLADGAEPCA